MDNFYFVVIFHYFFHYFVFIICATIACESSSGFIYKLIKEDNHEKEYNFNNNVDCISMFWNNYLFSA